MSDTKHTPSGAVGRQYHLAVVEKKDKEIAALRAAAEKAREVVKMAIRYINEASESSDSLVADATIAAEKKMAKEAFAALEEVLNGKGGTDGR